MAVQSTTTACSGQWRKRRLIKLTGRNLPTPSFTGHYPCASLAHRALPLCVTCTQGTTPVRHLHTGHYPCASLAHRALPLCVTCTRGTTPVRHLHTGHYPCASLAHATARNESRVYIKRDRPQDLWNTKPLHCLCGHS